MSGAEFLNLATLVALALLMLALFAATIRIARGPTLPDRVLGLDVLTTVATGYIGVIAVRTGFMLYVDIAIALSLVAFLATVAFARYILMRGAKAREGSENAGETRQ
ncbi:cation:proton antiporter [Paradevosia shaoguanensis]|uniref:cation:proton antiporter n=1 Tax=Paradevosia shaoguanensis TaxID=1335043 RepID=UPI003C750E3C